MSSPRAATSLAIKNAASPFLNWSRVRRRACWSISPCSETAASPCFLRSASTPPISRLRLQKMMALLTSSCANKRCKKSRFCDTSTRTTAWRIFAPVDAGGAASMRCGADKNRSANRVISGGMVAENNSVCRVKGTSPIMRSISGMKPISSIRSASSITSTSTPRNSTLPRSTWSSSRPGVAISTSAPRSMARSWSLNDTPPMSRALVSLVFLP